MIKSKGIVKTLRTARLGPQITFRGRLPKRGEFAIANEWNWHKPEGGLWTSTYSEQTGGDWVKWCLGEEFGTRNGTFSQHGWLLVPTRDARVLRVNNLEDLRRVVKAYRQKNASKYSFAALDFLQMAKDYDAMHLTEKGQWRTRFSRPGLYGWDCESTVWLRWKFQKVVDLGKLTFGEPARKQVAKEIKPLALTPKGSLRPRTLALI